MLLLRPMMGWPAAFPTCANHRTMPKSIPVSTLTRYAADPESFTARRQKNSAEARHGIRLYVALTTPRRSGIRAWVWLLLAAIGLLIAFVFA